MAVLSNGHGIAPQFIIGASAGDAGTPVSGAVPTPGVSGTVAVDGTPVRVVVLAFAAAAGLVALKMAGFRFNVGVSN
jgi:hypothetical protein